MVVWAGKSWKELNVQGKEQRYIVGRFGSRELNSAVIQSRYQNQQNKKLKMT